MALNIKKIFTQTETIYFEGFKKADTPTTRVVVAAVIDNPYAGRYSENLDELIAIGEELGTTLTEIALKHLPGPVHNYAKGAIVGLNGELEHGGATLHPKLGQAMRKTINLPCSALISCNKKVAGPDAQIDLPLMFRDEAAIRTHYDTIPNFGIPGAPKPDEMVIIIAVTDGGRPHPRIGGLTLSEYEKRRVEAGK